MISSRYSIACDRSRTRFGSGLFGLKPLLEDIVKKLEGLVGSISKEQDFRSKMKSMCIQPCYEDGATHQKPNSRYKQSMTEFIKEKAEGL